MLLTKKIESHRQEMHKIKDEKESEIENLQKTLTSTNQESTNELKNLLLQSSKQTNAIEILQYDFEFDLNHLTKIKEQKKDKILKEHNSKMSFFDHKNDLELKEIEDNHLLSIDRLKKILSNDLKYHEEKENIETKYLIESLQNEIEITRQNKIKDFQEKCEAELDALKLEIDIKSIEKKELETQMQTNTNEYTKELSVLQNEYKDEENIWVEEKKKYKEEWNNRFDKLKQQFSEEERQNEEARKMDQNKYQEIMDKLKQDLSDEEERGLKEIKEIDQKIQEETERGNEIINNLKKEINDLQMNKTLGIETADKKLKLLEEERMNVLKESQTAKHNEVCEEKKKCKEDIANSQKELEDMKKQLINLNHEYEKEVTDLKNKLNQANIDNLYEINEFERKKQLEISKIQNQNEYQIEALNVKLEYKQSQIDQLTNEKDQRINYFKALEKRRCSEIENEIQNVGKIFKSDNEKIAKDKEKIITNMEENIKIYQEKIKNQEPRQEDLENINRLEEILSERVEAIQTINEYYKQYESAFIDHESRFIQLKSQGNASTSRQPTPISAKVNSQKRLKKDSGLTAVKSFQKKAPNVIEPKRNKTPI